MPSVPVVRAFPGAATCNGGGPRGGEYKEAREELEAVRARGGADEPATFAGGPVSVPFTLTWRTCCGGGPGGGAKRCWD